MTGKRMWGAVAIVALSWAGLAQDLEAQAASSETSVRIERADLLADHALLLAKQRADYRNAASFMREAALLYGEGSDGVHALIQAAHLSYYGGRPLNAVSALRRAGEVALAIGDAETAADSFWRAAWVANRAGEIPTARELYELSEVVRQRVVADRLAG